MLTEGSSDTSDEFLIPAAITDTGCERELNEDRYAVIESRSGLSWLVCDGMGGVTGGELAAQLAIDAIRRDLENLPSRPAETAIRSAILEANRIIVLRRQNQAFAGMGTTVVGAIFQGSEVVVANAGDSRVYLIRHDSIQQLTTDHTLVQEMVDKGQIRADEALSHPQAHILTRCIGSEPGLQIDTKRMWVWPTASGESSDYLLLCSDGLYSLIAEAEMVQHVSMYPPQKACVRLVELAKSRGGFDNITLAIVPLGGQLRLDPPAGYDSVSALRTRANSMDSFSGSDSLVMTGLFAAALTLLAVVFVLLAVAYMMSA